MFGENSYLIKKTDLDILNLIDVGAFQVWFWVIEIT